MATTSKQKAGRKYSVDSSGITTLKKDFVVIQDSPMAADGEVLSFGGVPEIGSAHPQYSGLYVQSYDVQEGGDNDKRTLIVTANYGPQTIETGEGTGDASRVEEWGWDDGTDEIELTSGQDGTPVLNSAGDPFESVPKIMTPSPVFTKVVKYKIRKSGWNTAFCTVNSNAVTIGGISFPARSLLCTISEKRLLDGGEWKYRYTVKLRYKKNLVKIEGSNALVDIGWDVAVLDAGMREKITNGSTVEKRLIREIDKETGKTCVVTSPALLDGSGAKLASGGTPYNIRFQAYAAATLPSWCYSEPT
jgi:hypothetical protein